MRALSPLFCGAIAALSIAGCVTYDGVIEGAERQRVKRMFKGDEEPAKARGNQYAADAEVQELGRLLFFYPGFTAPGGKPTACASCHLPDRNFSDGLARGFGASGKELARRSPSIYQSFHRHFVTWDGDTDSLWAQALGPIEDADEMGSNRLRVLHAIVDDPTMRAQWQRAFVDLPKLPAIRDARPCKPGQFPHDVPTKTEQTDQFMAVQAQAAEEPAAAAAAAKAPDPKQAWCDAWARELDDGQRREISGAFARVGKAIAAYETKIESKDSAFDRFLEGGSLDAAATRGLELFVGKGQCVRCHDGPDLTDDKFHFLGIPDLVGQENAAGKAYGEASSSMWLEGAFRAHGGEFSCLTAEDFGQKCDRKGRRRLRAGVGALIRLGQRVVAGRVRTPSLRNVAEGQFFMHDGSVQGLAAAVQFYTTRPDGRTPVFVLDRELRTKLVVQRKIRKFAGIGKRVDRRARNIDLSEAEVGQIVAFLRTLTGAPIADKKWITDPWASAGGAAPPTPEPTATEP